MSEALARTVALLLVPDAVEVDDDGRAAAAELRAALTDRLGPKVEDAVGVLREPGLTVERFDGVVARLMEALAADQPLTDELSKLLADAERDGGAAAIVAAKARAVILRGLGRYEEALDADKAALRHRPDDAGSLYGSARSHRLLDRPEEALDRLRRAGALPDLNPEDHVLLAHELLLLGERDGARAEAATAAAAVGREAEPLPADSALGLSRVWSELEEPEKAVAALEPLLDGQGEPSADEVDAHIVAAQHLLMALGDATRVVDLMTRLGRRMGSLAGEPRARLWLGHALAELGRGAEALEWLDQRLPGEVPPDLRGWALFGRGTALLVAEEPGRAEPVLREALPLLRGELVPVARVALAIVLLGLRRVDDARAQLDQAAGEAREASPVPRGRVALWRAIAWNDDEARLREELARADELLPPGWPERAALTFWQARAVQRSDPERALSLLDSLAAPHPSWLRGAAMTRVVALSTLGRADEALAALAPLLDDAGAPVTTERAELSLARAGLLVRAGRPGDALAELAAVEAVALAGDAGGDAGDGLAVRFLRLRAHAATDADEREVLDAALTRLAERDPSTAPVAELVRVESMMLLGDPNGAFAALRTLEEPNDPDNPLAWVVAANARLVAERADTQAAIERAVALAPGIADAPIVRMTLALAAARRGDLDAVDAAYGAGEPSPEERVMRRYVRAAALRQAGRQAEAAAEFTAVETEAPEAASRLTATIRAQASAELAVLLVRLDDVAGAERAVARAEARLAGLPRHSGATLLARLARGVLHMKRGEHVEADTALAGAAAVADALPPGTSVAFAIDYLRGVNGAVAGDDAAEDARRWLASAVRRQPDDPDAREALGQVYLTLDEPAAALACFAHALAVTTETRATTSLLRDKATAQRRLGHLEASVETAREAATLDPEDARNWLSLGASQLELGRDDAASIAFRRGLRLRPWPPDRVATQLLLGLSKALLDADRPGDALEALATPLARRLAETERLIELNRSVALLRLGRDDDAVPALTRAGRAETADRLRAALARRDSWLGFWFGAGVSAGRRRLGGLLLAAAAVAMVLVVVDPERAGWLGWMATGNVRPLVPVAVVALLFLLPVVTRIRLGDVEIEQPAAAAPSMAEVQAVSWDAVDRKVTSIATVRIAAGSAGALPEPGGVELPPDPTALAVASSVTVATAQGPRA
jgi:tetratricopeptide (TPR) repeat protein